MIFRISVKKILSAGVCGVILLIPLSFTRPFGNPRQINASSGQLLAGARIPEPLRELVERKCGNCHSEQVEWPFYSRIAPVSWLLEHDVSEARAHLNLSRWDTYITATRTIEPPYQTCRESTQWRNAACPLHGYPQRFQTPVERTGFSIRMGESGTQAAENCRSTDSSRSSGHWRA